LVSPDGRDGSIATCQDGLMFGTLLAPGKTLDYRFDGGRLGYLHAARGRPQVGDVTLGIEQTVIHPIAEHRTKLHVSNPVFQSRPFA
jgi:hypothetical protein